MTRLFPLLLGLTPAAGAAPLQDGERFVYRVAWGLFGNAGTITVEADDEYLEGLRQTRITTQTSTRGFVRALYPFDGHVESVFDYRSGQLLAATARTTSKRRNTQAAIAFDYSTGLARYVDSFRPDRSTWVEIPEGSPMDLITSLINTRGWNLEVGEKRPVVVLFDDEFYDLVVTAERIETIDTPRGEREALLMVPRMEENPKGMFRRGGEVRVWLSHDAERLPLRLEVTVKVGTAVATLVEYRPPEEVFRHTHANSGS